VDFKDILKELRISRDMTQEELAEKISTKRANVGNWESGRVSPGFSIIKKIAEFFGVSTDYLLGTNYFPTNERPIVVISPEDLELLQSIKKLPENDQEAVKALINHYIIKDAVKNEQSSMGE
jgi:transcriptional regulator with XRE-family HTH domain